MEKNNDLFGGRSEAERLKNVANMVHDIVNAKPEEVEVQAETTETEGDTSPDPVVDMVGKAISTYKPKGMFMHMVNPDDKPES